MKNWKFIKVGNSDKEFKSEQELRRWAIDHQYTYKPTHGGYYMLEDDSGKGREPIEAHVSQPVVNKTAGNKKTGNKRYFDVEEEGGDSRSFPSLSEARKFADKWRSEGKQTVHIFEIEENDKDPDDFRIVRTHNESIEKQTWSMFKGLSKDAKKEVGNKKYHIWTDNGTWDRIVDEEELERLKTTYVNFHYEEVGNKVGNDSIGDEYNAEIYRLEKKKMDLESMGQGQKAREIEKQIQQLQKELREYDIGNKKTGNAGHWNSSKTMYAKWDDATGRPADEYAVITWLGEGKGGLVNIWKGHQMTSEKYGSNDLSDLRRWAEQRIGNTAHSDKVEVIKRLLAGGWSVEDIYSQLKTEGYEVEKGFIEKLKTGNEKISYPPEKLKDVSWVTLQYIIIHPEKYDEKTVELAKKIYANRIGNKKVDNARPKEQLLADVRELTKYIQEHPGQSCEKEKRLLGEAKEELDKEYGILVNNLKRARNSIKSGNRKAIGSHFDMNDYGIEVGQWSWDWKGSAPDRKTMQDIARKIKDYARQIDRDVPEGDSDERDEVFAKLDRFMQTQGLK